MSKRSEEARKLLGYIYPVCKIMEGAEGVLRRYIFEDELEETGGYRGDGANDLSENHHNKHLKSWTEISYMLNMGIRELNKQDDVLGMKPQIESLLKELETVGDIKEEPAKVEYTDEEFMKALDIVLSRLQ